VDVEGSIASPGGLTGFCSVNADNSHPTLLSNFAGAFNNPSSVPAQPGTWSFSGMLVVPSNQTPATTHIYCDDNLGNGVAITNIKWWVSPVGG
jgi:hypothetical protein